MKALTASEKRRRQAALTIVRTLSEETSVVAKPLSSVNIKNIPDNAEYAIRSYIRTLKNHEVYGSSSMATHSIHARRPADLDIVVTNPRKVAYDFSNIMRRKGIKTKVVGNPEWGSYVVQVCQKGEWVDCCDIHPIKNHGGSFDFYGSSKPPLNKKGILIQRASDQLLRKANSITGRRKDGTMGAAPHREYKDSSDFVQITELLLASMELKSKAQLSRAQKVKEELKIWKAHLAKLKGAKPTTKRKPLSATRKEKFIRKSITNSATGIDDLIFENGEVKERKVSITKATEAPKMVAVSPYYGVAQSPYIDKPKKRRRRVKKKATVPYGKLLGSTNSFSKNIKKVGRRKKKENRR